MNAPLHDYNSARCKLSNQCILFHPCWKVLVVILALAALTLPFSNTWIDFHLISHLVISYIHSHDLSVLDQHCQRHNGSMDGLTLALRSRLLHTLTSTIHAVFTFVTPLSLFFAFSSFRWISCLAGVDDVDVQEQDGDAEKMSSFLKIASSTVNFSLIMKCVLHLAWGEGYAHHCTAHGKFQPLLEEKCRQGLLPLTAKSLLNISRILKVKKKYLYLF